MAVRLKVKPDRRQTTDWFLEDGKGGSGPRRVAYGDLLAAVADSPDACRVFRRVASETTPRPFPKEKLLRVSVERRLN